MWALVDGSHPGQPVVVLADGEHDVETASGSYPDDDAWSDRYVVGWTARCGCGWRAAPWFRAAEPWDTDETARVFYPQEHASVPSRVRELLRLEWRTHVQPGAALDVLEQRAREQREGAYLVDEAVRDARKNGASWADIARRLGMTRQAAHRRWRLDGTHENQDTA